MPGEAQLLRGVSHRDYHADDLAGSPRFSRSTAATMLLKSPLAAWAAHPLLGGRGRRKDTKASFMGTLCHNLLLGGGQEIELIRIHGDPKKHEPQVMDALNYKRAQAQALKADALAEGKLPVLAHELAAAREACSSIAWRLTALLGSLEGLAKEATILFDDEGVACKARLDLIAEDARVIVDPKFPEELDVYKWEKLIRYNPLYQMQAHSYPKAMEAVTGERYEMLFAICEWSYPYDVALIPAGPSVMEAGRIRWEQQRGLWKRCLETNDWPGVGRREPVEVPPEAVLDAAGLTNDERLDALFGAEEEG